MIVSTILLAYLSKINWKNFKSNKIDFLLLNKIYKFSFPLIAGGIAYWGITYIDRFFLKNYSGLNELGIYSIASTFAAIITVFTVIWHPLVYKWLKEGIEPKKIQDVMNILFILIIFISWIIPLDFLKKQ